MPIVISKAFNFEASHVLPRHPGKCSRLHGHSWVLEVAVLGAIDPTTGFVMDYGELKELVQREIVDQVDHQHLGAGDILTNQRDYLTPSIIPHNFYPSSENLVVLFSKILLDRLKSLPRTPGQPEIELYTVSLKETCTSEAIWFPE